MHKFVASLFAAALMAAPPAALAHHGKGGHAPSKPGNSNQQQQQEQEQNQDQEQSQCIVVIGLLQPAEC